MKELSIDQRFSLYQTAMQLVANQNSGVATIDLVLVKAQFDFMVETIQGNRRKPDPVANTEE